MPIQPLYTIPATQFASSEETMGGTADNKAVTPRGLNAALRYMGLLVPPMYNSIYLRLDAVNSPLQGPLITEDIYIKGARKVSFYDYGGIPTPGEEMGYIMWTKSGITPGIIIQGINHLILSAHSNVQISDAGLTIGNTFTNAAPQGDLWIDAKMKFLTEITTPATPLAGEALLYSKDTGGATRLWAMVDDGVEHDLFAAGGGGGGGGMVNHGNEYHVPDFIPYNNTLAGDTKTKITFDMKGLVTSGQDATYTDVGAEQAGAVAAHAGLTAGVHEFNVGGDATFPSTIRAAAGGIMAGTYIPTAGPGEVWAQKKLLGGSLYVGPSNQSVSPGQAWFDGNVWIQKGLSVNPTAISAAAGDAYIGNYLKAVGGFSVGPITRSMEAGYGAMQGLTIGATNTTLGIGYLFVDGGIGVGAAAQTSGIGSADAWIAGALSVGATAFTVGTAPGEIWASSNIKNLGGQSVGSLVNAPPAGQLWAQGPIVATQLMVGPQMYTTTLQGGDIWAYGSHRARGGIALGPTLVTAPDAAQVWLLASDTLGASPAFGGSAGIRMAPKYTGITSLRTVTRHNYQVYHNIQATLATATEAVAMYFDQVAGLHRLIDTGVTPPTTQKVKASMNTVQAWLKVQVGSSLGYIPIYMNKFS